MARVGKRVVHAWYDEQEPLAQRLAKSVTTTLELALHASGIPFVAVTARVKTRKGVIEKLERKGYADLSKFTDLVGIRVVLYRKSDVGRASDIIAKTYTVHPEDSSDKGDDLGEDKLGYRSVHFTCDLGARATLPENTALAGKVFEVQVRTILEHAWAELEHKRGYKAEALPKDLRRKLNLIAGALELVDGDLDRIVTDIDVYIQRTKADAERAMTKEASPPLPHVDTAPTNGQVTATANMTLNPFVVNATATVTPPDSPSDAEVMEFLRAPIDAISVKSLVDVYLRDVLTLTPLGEHPDVNQDVLDELRRFGIQTNDELTDLFSDEFIDALRASKAAEPATWIGAVRDAMMYADLDRYIDVAWQRHWIGFPENQFDFLVPKYSRAKVEAVEERILSEEQASRHPLPGTAGPATTSTEPTKGDGGRDK